MENSKIVSKRKAENYFIDQDQFPKVREIIAEKIRNIVPENPNAEKQYLYYVNPGSSKKLHKIFLDNIPNYARQYYTCNACFVFINRFGSLVTVDDKGHLHSVCWDVPLTEVGMFAPAFNEMKKAVESGNIKNVFSYDEKNKFMKKSGIQELTLGIPVTGDWDHFYGTLDLANIYAPTYRVSEEEFREKLNIARENLNKFHSCRSGIKKALAYAESGELFNADKVMIQGRLLLNLTEKYVTTINRNARINLMWENSDFLYHLGGSSIGTLFEDFWDGNLSDDECIARYNSKVDPLKYKRSQAAPSEALIKQAEKLISDLGAENSLKRRFALVSDLPRLLWTPKADEDDGKEYRSGIFSKVKSKENAKDDYELVHNDGGKITLVKFMKSVAPDAKRITVMTPVRGSYAAYTTAVDMEAPCIIKWDSKEVRNAISQYVYNNGSYRTQWNIFGSEADCVGIANFPEDLLSEELSSGGALFILDHAYDTENNASALFADNLIPELFQIRKVIESFSNATPLERPEGQKACGLTYNGGTLYVKVYTDYAVTSYCIDRLD